MASLDRDICPPVFMLKSLYKSLCINLSKSVLKKLKDASTLKSNISNPHNRQVQILNVLRLIFAGVYGKSFLPEERKDTTSTKSSPVFEIKSLERLSYIVGSDSLVKFHHGGDVSLITDRLPAWCKDYKINDIISIKPEQLRYKLGNGLMSAIAKQNYTVILKNQVEENDYLQVRGQYLQVYATSVDFNSDARNCVRFTRGSLAWLVYQEFMV